MRKLVTKYKYVAMVSAVLDEPWREGRRQALRPPLAALCALSPARPPARPPSRRPPQDTEFPGVVARPIGSFSSHTDYHYQTLRCNVDLLKIIQLGITFADENGELADDCPTWQFNFKFNLQEDMYAQDSIDLLTRSGIEFKTHEERGIEVDVFGELLMTSGLVLSDEIKWISFHSGYDFGYLLKLLTFAPLPRAWRCWRRSARCGAARRRLWRRRAPLTPPPPPPPAQPTRRPSSTSCTRTSPSSTTSST